jgi:hypothetical protein
MPTGGRVGVATVVVIGPILVEHTSYGKYFGPIKRCATGFFIATRKPFQP